MLAGLFDALAAGQMSAPILTQHLGGAGGALHARAALRAELLLDDPLSAKLLAEIARVCLYAVARNPPIILLFGGAGCRWLGMAGTGGLPACA